MSDETIINYFGHIFSWADHFATGFDASSLPIRCNSEELLHHDSILGVVKTGPSFQLGFGIVILCAVHCWGRQSRNSRTIALKFVLSLKLFWLWCFSDSEKGFMAIARSDTEKTMMSRVHSTSELQKAMSHILLDADKLPDDLKELQDWDGIVGVFKK